MAATPANPGAPRDTASRHAQPGLGANARAYHPRVIIGVDIGNSAAKAALVDGSTVLESGRLDTSVATTADLAAGLRRLAGKATTPPTSIVAVSVVDRWTARLEHAARELGVPLVLATAATIPLPTALLRPDLTGPDRLLAAWTGARLHGRPVIVIDLGTATTVDAVDADGFFLGGAILPGLGLSAYALAEGTARLPRVELDLPADVIGSDTAAAIRSGVVLGQLGAVRELVARMRHRLAVEPRLVGMAVPDGASRPGAATTSRTTDQGLRAAAIVTGGHAAAAWASRAWLEPGGPDLPPIADQLDPELVLRGLGLLSEHLGQRPGTGASA
jgi:type III pantothenate kinase